jgi:molybdopterin-guanine dinucleotide biosynthesis protein A
MRARTPLALAGLVLCGGESSRMGRDKALIPVGGTTLVLHTAQLLARIAHPVLVAPGRPGRLGALGYEEVEDDPPDTGPMGAIAAGLAASPHPLLAVAAVDMPFASPPLFSLLASLHGDEQAVVPRSGAGPEPLHAVYAASARPTIREALLQGELAARTVLSRLRVRWVDEGEWIAADPLGRFAMNLNREEDLAILDGLDGLAGRS